MTRSVGTAALLVVVSGCYSETIHTHLEMADPSRARLLGGPARGSTEVVPPGTTPGAAILAEDSFETEPGARAHYAVLGRRGEKGEIDLEWQARVPILNGETQVLVDPGGRLDLPQSTVTPQTLERTTLQVSGCAALIRSTVRGTFVGYRAEEWQDCVWPASAPYTLDTPWDNVISLRQHAEPEKAGALGFMILSSVLFGGAGAALAAAHGGTAQHVVGWSLVGVGVLIDVSWLPTLVASPREIVAYPR